MENEDDFEYAGFWIRVGAALIDSLLLLVVILPILMMFYGEEYLESELLIQGPMDFVVSWVAPAVCTIAFWIIRQATPGKMALNLTIIDANSGARLGTGQSIGRYFAYFLSAIPLCLGIFWIAFDSRKQGWHDKLAGTLVVRRRVKASAQLPGSVALNEIGVNKAD